MGGIISQVVSKGKTKLILDHENLIKALGQYLSKNKKSAESIVIELINHLELEIAGF